MKKEIKLLIESFFDDIEDDTESNVIKDVLNITYNKIDGTISIIDVLNTKYPYMSDIIKGFKLKLDKRDLTKPQELVYIADTVNRYHKKISWIKDTLYDYSGHAYRGWKNIINFGSEEYRIKQNYGFIEMQFIGVYNDEHISNRWPPVYFEASDDFETVKQRVKKVFRLIGKLSSILYDHWVDLRKANSENDIFNNSFITCMWISPDKGIRITKSINNIEPIDKDNIKKLTDLIIRDKNDNCYKITFIYRILFTGKLLYNEFL